MALILSQLSHLIVGKLNVGGLLVKVVLKSVNFVFVNGGNGTKVARARSWTCCITIPATTTETGDPVAVPCNCL